MYKKDRTIKAHDAKPIANPVPRPDRIMVRVVADTQDHDVVGVSAICGPSEHESLRDLSIHLQVLMEMPWVRSIHVYLPEETSNARE